MRRGHYSHHLALKAMAGADDFLALLADFDEVLASVESKESRKQYILQHFAKIDKKKSFQIPDFDKGGYDTFR